MFSYSAGTAVGPFSPDRSKGAAKPPATPGRRLSKQFTEKIDVSVTLRIRPLSAEELAAGDEPCLTFDGCVLGALSLLGSMFAAFFCIKTVVCIIISSVSRCDLSAVVAKN